MSSVVMADSRFAIAWRFGAVMVVAIVVLGVLNAVPQFVGGEPLGVVRYGSIQQAEARLGVRLAKPAAVPAGWISPPARVRLAVGRPDWVEFVYEHASGLDPLIVCQTVGAASDGATVPAALLPAGELMQAGALDVGDRAVRLQRLLLDNGVIVHEAWWRDGGRHVMLRARVTADGLPRIARTILGTQ